MCFLAVQMTKSGFTGLQLQGSKKKSLPHPLIGLIVQFCLNVTINKTSKLLHPVAFVKVEKTLLVQMVHSVGECKNKVCK